MKSFHKLSSFVALCLLFGGIASLAAADTENPGDYLHSRTYIGLIGTSVSVDNGGEFSGLNYARMDTPSYEIDLLPALAQNFGYGLMLGHREEAWAVEASFWQSNHNATFGPGAVGSVSGSSVTFTQQFQDTAVYNSVNVDFKRYFITESQTQPYISLGVSFPWIVVNHAANDASGNNGSLTLAGLGFNLGVGTEYYLSPNLSFFGTVFKRWASFDEFKGLASQYNQLSQFGTKTSDDGSGFNFAIGTTLGFE